MRDYRWGIFLAERDPDRRIGFGEHKGEPAWQEVPGEYRATCAADRDPGRHRAGLRRAAAQPRRPRPELYDLRNLFQVNVEEGRHLWAMVYLLHAYFGRDGREEAEELLHRNSGSAGQARASSAPSTRRRRTGCRSSCSPTSPTATASTSSARSSRVRLRPAVAHLRVHAEGGGAPHVRRHHRHRPRGGAHRAGDVRERHRRRRGATAAIPLPVIQKYLNFHYSVSLDLFGGETSTNVANYYTAGLKGRWPRTGARTTTKLTDDSIMVDALIDGEIAQTEVAALVGLNTDLRREYIDDCEGGVKRWNRILEEAGLPQRLHLPHVAFNRKVGAFAAIEATPTAS
jgi:benzoyl-CoA 2,3-dioxygenase component B